MAITPMNVIVGQVTSQIPQHLLGLVFKNIRDGQFQDMSIDECLKKVIIEGIVLPSINAACGKPKDIPLQGDWLETSADMVSRYLGGLKTGELYRIPAWVRENRDIIEIRQVKYAYAYAEGGGVSPASIMASGNSLFEASEALMASHSMQNASIAPTATLRDNNLVMIVPSMASDGYILDCLIGYDAEFTNAPRGMHMPLARYVVAVTKGFIHNSLIIDLDLGQLIGGAQLGIIRDLVTRYGDEGSEAVQREHLEHMRGAALYDPENMSKMLSMVMPG